jgi:hypothetical protein
MDEDLSNLTKDELIAEVTRLREGHHRDSSGHDLCWHHPQLWSLLPEPIPQDIAVPAWPQFLHGCIKYREAARPRASQRPAHRLRIRPGKRTILPANTDPLGLIWVNHVAWCTHVRWPFARGTWPRLGPLPDTGEIRKTNSQGQARAPGVNRMVSSLPLDLFCRAKRRFRNVRSFAAYGSKADFS